MTLSGSDGGILRVIRWALNPLLCFQHPVKEVEPPDLGAGEQASKWFLNPQTTAKVEPGNESLF